MTLEDFRIAFPEFSSASDPAVETAIANAEMELSVSKWATYHDRGVGQLTAHFLFMANSRISGNVAGELESWSADGNSIKFQASTGGKEAGIETVYWREYDRLAKKVGGRQDRSGLNV